MKTIQLHDHRATHTVTYEFSVEQAEALDRGEPVAWYGGDEQVFVGPMGPTVVRSAARPGGVPAAVVRGG